MNTSLAITICVTFIVAFLFSYIIQVKPLQDKNKRNKEDLDYYKGTYLSKQGGTAMLKGFDILNYHLKSFDGGKIWYAIDNDKWFNDKGLIILGKADDVYPGLLSHLDGLDKLTKHVEDNGPIDPGQITQEQIDILDKAGIAVKIDTAKSN